MHWHEKAITDGYFDIRVNLVPVNIANPRWNLFPGIILFPTSISIFFLYLNSRSACMRSTNIINSLLFRNKTSVFDPGSLQNSSTPASRKCPDCNLFFCPSISTVFPLLKFKSTEPFFIFSINFADSDTKGCNGN